MYKGSALSYESYKSIETRCSPYAGASHQLQSARFKISLSSQCSSSIFSKSCQLFSIKRQTLRGNTLHIPCIPKTTFYNTPKVKSLPTSTYAGKEGLYFQSIETGSLTAGFKLVIAGCLWLLNPKIPSLSS